MRNALIRYRIMAYLVGCLLVVLVCVGLPLKYLGDNSAVVTFTAVPHGYLYMILLITAVDLGRRAKWTLEAPDPDRPCRHHPVPVVRRRAFGDQGRPGQARRRGGRGDPEPDRTGPGNPPLTSIRPPISICRYIARLATESW